MTATNNTKSLSDMTPTEIDTLLAAAWERLNGLRIAIDEDMLRLKRSEDSGIVRNWYTLSETRLAEIRQRIAQNEAECAIPQAEIKRIDVEFRARGGWTRYYMVHGGHVHRERSCSSCTYRTRFGWLVDLSACDEDAMVKVHGDAACAICFPGVLEHPAYIASAKLRQAAEAAEALGLCSMSGKGVPDAKLRSQNWKYARCPDCRQMITLLRSGAYRKHAPKGRK